MVGEIILCVFAAIVWVIGIWATGNGSALLYAIPLVVSGAILIALMCRSGDRPMPPVARKRIGRVVGFASAFEGIAILAAYALVPQMQAVDFAFPVVAMIVGLHFIPLARVFAGRLYYVTAALLIVLGTTGFGIPNPDLRILYVSIGIACVYWLTCLVALRNGYM
jgi:hypothetical protein